jgi:uncharacterized surface protein with fasciclin (FAS1) repeats
MSKSLQVILLGQLLLLVFACNDEFSKNPKYDRPSWLAGKVYAQVKAQPELSDFARCLERTGYDTLINTSGDYTVFAPDNDAFELYFSDHPEYQTVDDIPLADLTRIVKYHIIQNPWSLQQLRSLDIYGWIDSTDINNDEPKGFKRETLLKEKNRKYGVTQNFEQDDIIVDTLASPWYRRQATDSRKFAPLFYKEYFSIYHLNVSDYAFYFGRSFEQASDMYYANGRIIKGDIFAENGFVHIIDRVVDPLRNAYQIMNSQSGGYSYKKFLDMVNTFPSFTFDENKTLDQPGASEGKQVDSLFNISYPELAFDIINEKTKAPAGTTGLPSDVTIRYHEGLIAPTDAAFDDFIAKYISGPGKWGSLRETPHHIRRMMVNSGMASGPVYPTDLTRGFYNGENDLITVDPSTVVQKEFGSNCTFMGVNKMIVPRAFSSVTGPIYLERGYSRIMYAIEASGLLPALKRENEHYMLFAESDANLALDSSLVYFAPTTTIPARFATYLTTGNPPTRINLSTNDLRILVLNHIGLESPVGLARKEFIKNLAGNFIIVNNQTHEVSGMTATTYGYQGVDIVHVIPQEMNFTPDNGHTYDISNWFNFSASTLFLKISTTYPNFHALLKKAGLTKDKEYRYTFISDNDNYSVFVPNDAALAAYRTDTLTTDELKKFLLMHFVTGNMIFTDGKMASGYYETSRIDEKSTPYTTIYTKIHIQPGIDVIDFPAKEGGNYLRVNESDKTNIITARNVGTGTEAYPNILSNAVIHEIDKVLLYNQVDTK